MGTFIRTKGKNSNESWRNKVLNLMRNNAIAYNKHLKGFIEDKDYNVIIAHVHPIDRDFYRKLLTNPKN